MRIVLPPSSLPYRVDVLLDGPALHRALVEDVRRGLTATPKSLPPRWFYDERGSLLFEEITRLPEYYPTRCERRILVARAGEIARASGADTLVELGSGSSEKTRLLLDALRASGTLRRYVPLDVSESMLRVAARGVLDEYPGLSVHAVVGDFEAHLSHVPHDGRRMVAFLGGTVGNLEPPARARFLAALADTLRPGDTLLLGTDLLKDRARLHAAYNDSARITAAFNLNLLSRLNRELGATFDLRAFEHEAEFNEDQGCIEMFLRARGAHRVELRALGLAVDFAEGERLRTEVSCKFTREGVRGELAAVGLGELGWWTDPEGLFALSLWRRGG